MSGQGDLALISPGRGRRAAGRGWGDGVIAAWAHRRRQCPPIEAGWSCRSSASGAAPPCTRPRPPLGPGCRKWKTHSVAPVDETRSGRWPRHPADREPSRVRLSSPGPLGDADVVVGRVRPSRRRRGRAPRTAVRELEEDEGPGRADAERAGRGRPSRRQRVAGGDGEPGHRTGVAVGSRVGTEPTVGPAPAGRNGWGPPAVGCGGTAPVGGGDQVGAVAQRGPRGDGARAGGARTATADQRPGERGTASRLSGAGGPPAEQGDRHREGQEGEHAARRPVGPGVDPLVGADGDRRLLRARGLEPPSRGSNRCRRRRWARRRWVPPAQPRARAARRARRRPAQAQASRHRHVPRPSWPATGPPAPAVGSLSK